jgi:hypothetical protein
LMKRLSLLLASFFFWKGKGKGKGHESKQF